MGGDSLVSYGAVLAKRQRMMADAPKGVPPPVAAVPSLKSGEGCGCWDRSAISGFKGEHYRVGPILQPWNGHCKQYHANVLPHPV